MLAHDLFLHNGDGARMHDHSFDRDVVLKFLRFVVPRRAGFCGLVRTADVLGLIISTRVIFCEGGEESERGELSARKVQAGLWIRVSQECSTSSGRGRPAGSRHRVISLDDRDHQLTYFRDGRFDHFRHPRLRRLQRIPALVRVGVKVRGVVGLSS